uniref:Sulfotransferase family protein n=1 Tax=Marseillevirus LCMAC201 TaxID=2506605 RepID=A0A481YWA4_9VIRU|nr:MAG: hypothetical protein LCMAC201_03780 [Marseillevirus LCMAC201]
MRTAGILHYYYGSTRDKTIYQITRDPYKRLESFYREKMIKNLTPALNQFCQQKLLKFFTRKQLVNKQVSFKEFIQAVAQGYSDEHIALQTTRLNGKPDHLVKLELGLSLLTPLLGVNPDDFIGNTTTDIHIPLVWTKEMRTSINILYATDFVNMQYSML